MFSRFAPLQHRCAARWRRDVPSRLAVCLAICLIWAIGRSSDARGAEPSVRLPGDIAVDEIDFRRHVLPLVSKLGCNAGRCHGSFQGRGGFRLSLFGHAPVDDFAAISDRVDKDHPAESLLVAKPSSKTDHEGGQHFLPESWEYQLLAAWIRQGASASKIEDAVLPRLETTSRAIRLRVGDAATIAISARFGDGKPEAVTPLCRVESSDPAVVEIAADGRAVGIRAGMASIIVSYAGRFVTIPVTIPFTSEGQEENATLLPQAVDADSPPEAAPRVIDNWIQSRLTELNLPCAPITDDAQFLRRVTLDAVGRLPTPDEIRQFLASGDANKRAATIDRLLADPQHASLWATRLCDITGCRLEAMEGPDNLKHARARMWHAWFRKRLLANTPIDQLVRGVLAGTSRGELSGEQYVEREIALVRAAEAGGVGEYADRPTLDFYWRRVSPAGGVYPREEMAERTAAAFLGIQIECARCHKHPYDRWTQTDYAAFVNVFADVTFGSSVEVNRAVLARLDRFRNERASGAEPAAIPRLQEMYDDPRQAQLLSDPKRKQLVAPRLLGGREINQDENGRDVLANWITQQDNPYFARNWVNRVWAHYFGRGLVDPVDNFSGRNPPTHPELLDALSAQFVRSGFDMRLVERSILNSRAYQLSSAPPARTQDAARYYACATVRPLMTEATVQALNHALGSANAWSGDVPAGGSVWDIGASRPADPRLAYLFELFGRGTREFVCDHSRSTEVTLRQTLHLMADGEWIEQIRTSALVTDLTAEPSVPQALANAFLRTLSRPPTSAEGELLAPHVSAAADRKEAWVDIVWALLNSREFRTNH
jgi:hypothetical protein